MKQKYGKLIDGTLRLHGSDFPIENENGGITITNDPELLAAHGFKPVTENPADPPEGYVAVGWVWVETEIDICRQWEYAPEEDTDYGTPTVEERLEAVELLLDAMLGGDGE